MIELCAVCLSIVHNQQIPTVTDNNVIWNDISYDDYIRIQRNTMKLWRKDEDSRLPMVAMTKVRGTSYCGRHIPKGQLTIMEMFPSRS